VIGPLLFVIFINDLPDSMVQHIKLYTDDSKISSIIKSEADCESLQADIDTAVEWTHRWLMFFNIKKCKVMHVGQANKSNHVYTMTSTDGSKRPLESTKIERDLGVLVEENLSSA
jgi:ribonuclease P/MRP protein subunit RPP40